MVIKFIQTFLSTNSPNFSGATGNGDPLSHYAVIITSCCHNIIVSVKQRDNGNLLLSLQFQTSDHHYKYFASCSGVNVM